MWEEPNISGKNGSGAVFFSGCVLRCEYCQNAQISRASCGKITDAQGLADVFSALEQQGAHNINLVSPTPYVPVIARALTLHRPKIPVVFNCGGYEKPETLQMLKGLVDIWLPDFKYGIADTAKKYSSAPDYPAVAARALETMLALGGAPVHNAQGMMQSGVMVRHLVLPGNIENSLAVLGILDGILPKTSLVSLMAQYFPTGNEIHPELSRRVTEEEYETVFDKMTALGFENGFAQELDSADSRYVPDFDINR